MSKISELSDGGSLQSTDFLIAVRSGGNVKVQADGAVTGTTGQFSTSLNVDGTVTADGLTVDASEANILGGSSTTGATTTLIIGSGTNTPDSIHGIQFRDRYGTSGFPDGQIGAFIQAERSTTSANYDLVLGTTTSSATDAVEHLRISHDGNVGIGTNSPNAPAGNKALHIKGTAGSELVLERNDTGVQADDFIGGLAFLNSDASNTPPHYSGITSRASNEFGAGRLEFFSTFEQYPSGAPDMVLDANGNLLVGTTSEINLGDTTGSGVQLNGIGAFVKRTCTTATQSLLNLNNIGTTGNVVDFYIDGIQKGALGCDSGAALTFVAGTGSSEVARIDTSGNLLVGGTATNPAGSGTDGIALSSGGRINAQVSGDQHRLGRGETGDILGFYSAGSLVGSIGEKTSRLFFAQTGGSGISMSGVNLLPTDGSGAANDNTNDIGFSSFRFDDIYATNGTIQTSDRNEKQDIAELDEAERRVAVAAKGLLRKFRWISSVEEKGDDARIHFGIIAQDLQAAFEAEGLDAGRYAMFIHSTWTDEETGEERSRMGVRYSELLAFIIAAL